MAKTIVEQARHELARSPFADVLETGTMEEMRAGEAGPQFSRYMKLTERSKLENAEWLDKTFRAIREGRPFCDCIEVNWKGRIEGHWETLRRSVDKPLPSYAEAFIRTLKEGASYWLFQPADRTEIFYRPERGDVIMDCLGSDIQTSPYAGDERLMAGYVEPKRMNKLRDSGVQKGRIGFWGIRDENPMEGFGFGRRSGDKDERVITGFVPKVKIDNHPDAGRVHFSVSPRGEVLLRGGLPIDERGDVYRVEVPLPEGVDYVSAVFGAYEGDERLRGHPLMIYNTGTIKQKKHLLKDNQ